MGNNKKSKKVLWTTIAILTLLLFSAAGGYLGGFIVVLGVAAVILGIYAAAKGQAPKFGIRRRKTGIALLIAGAYALLLGGLTVANVDTYLPTSRVLGTSCEVAGSASSHSYEELYCVPDSSDSLVWSTPESFERYMETQQRISSELEEQLADQDS